MRRSRPPPILVTARLNWTNSDSAFVDGVVNPRTVEARRAAFCSTRCRSQAGVQPPVARRSPQHGTRRPAGWQAGTPLGVSAARIPTRSWNCRYLHHSGTRHLLHHPMAVQNRPHASNARPSVALAVYLLPQRDLLARHGFCLLSTPPPPPLTRDGTAERSIRRATRDSCGGVETV